jgi:flagellum-specific ATP synthase
VPSALERARIDMPLQTGVRVLDTLATVGRGQRLGLFAGSGVGKSSLLSMVARGTEAEVSVIALVGERGREVREFLEDDLGPEGLARSVVVVATSDEPALMRLRAASTATRIAESFREQGAHALLMMDSLTRVAMAQREVGLSAGEPPATRGYPPSAFALLARLLERAGTARTGSVTGIYTVLVDGDDHNEPVADAARSILDGHVVLERKLAVMGHFPPIDVLGSVSRVAGKVNPPERTAWAAALRRVLAARTAAQDLIDVGAYQRGGNPLVDAALDHAGEIDAFLRQGLDERTASEDAWARLSRLATILGGPR